MDQFTPEELVLIRMALEYITDEEAIDVSYLPIIMEKMMRLAAKLKRMTRHHHKGDRQ